MREKNSKLKKLKQRSNKRIMTDYMINNLDFVSLRYKNKKIFSSRSFYLEILMFSITSDFWRNISFLM